MSIEKLSDESQVIRESNPFAQITNEVIEHIKDNDSYRLYSFLLSKDSNWKVIKEYARKICGVGQEKAKKCWSYLYRCGLTVNIPIKDSKGKILRHDMRVLNGLKFNKDEPFINVNKKLSSVDKSTGMETIPVDFSAENPQGWKPTPLDNRPLLNKDKIQNKEKNKSFYENEKKHEWANQVKDCTKNDPHADRPKIPDRTGCKDILSPSAPKASEYVENFMSEKKSNIGSPVPGLCDTIQ